MGTIELIEQLSAECKILIGLSIGGLTSLIIGVILIALANRYS